MSLADEMKNLVEEIKAGKAERRQRLGDIKKETAKDLSTFASERKEMASNLSKSLKASTGACRREVAALTKGFRVARNHLGEDIRAMGKFWRGVPKGASPEPKKET